MQDSFEQRIDDRLINIERDVSFIKGMIEGKSEAKVEAQAKHSRILSITAIVISTVSVILRALI